MNTAVPCLPTTSGDDIRAAFDAQRATALRLRSSTAAERRARIRRLLDAVMANREAFYEAGARDFNKPPSEMDLSELLPVIMEV